MQPSGVLDDRVVAVQVGRAARLVGARRGDDLVRQAVIFERLGEFVADGAEGIELTRCR